MLKVIILREEINGDEFVRRHGVENEKFEDWTFDSRDEDYWDYDMEDYISYINECFGDDDDDEVNEEFYAIVEYGGECRIFRIDEDEFEYDDLSYLEFSSAKEIKEFFDNRN